MKQFLLHAWDDIKEIILHLFTSLIVLICSSLMLYLIDFSVKLLFSEGSLLIFLMEMASQGIIFALFLVYLLKSLIRAIKNIGNYGGY